MMMEKVDKYLRRFKGGVEVREATVDDIATCAAFAFQNLVEYGLVTLEKSAENEAAIERLVSFALDVLLKRVPGVIQVAEEDGVVAGMVYCQPAGPDLWDGVEVCAISFLYVIPEFRKNPAVALSLMRTALQEGLSWGYKRFRVTIDDAHHHLIERYEDKFEFRLDFTHRSYSIDTED